MTDHLDVTQAGVVPGQAGIISAGAVIRASAAHQPTGVESVTAGEAVRRGPRFRLTDAGNSLRFTADHKNRLAYAPGVGWHVWDGRRWKRDDDGAVIRAAKETARRIRREAEEIEDPNSAAAVFKWATQSENAGKLRAMVELSAKGEHDSLGLVTPIEKFDRHPHLLVCSNGTLNLKTGNIRKSRPSDFLTRMVEVEYDKSASAGQWRRFLESIFDGDAELIADVKRSVGYSLTGETREQAVFIAHGSGANGKSVFIETVAAIIGDYAVTAAADTFVESQRGSASNDLARMRGARFVRVPETEDGARLARQIVKRVSGGDAIAARFLYAEHFEYVPEFKLWLVTNHFPAIPHTDAAAWRRIRPVPFRRTFSPSEQDKQLAGALRRELPGIFAWAVEGAKEWYASGLGNLPAASEEALDDQREQQDTVGRFLREETTPDGGGRVAKSELHSLYVAWCSEEGLRPISARVFHKVVRERGFDERKDAHGTRWFVGLSGLSPGNPEERGSP